MGTSRNIIEVNSCVIMIVQDIPINPGFGIPYLEQQLHNTQAQTHSPLCNRLSSLEDTLVSKGSSRIPSQNNIVCLQRNKSDLLHVTSLFPSFWSPIFSFFVAYFLACSLR